jgi:hypothetical protein
MFLQNQDPSEIDCITLDDDSSEIADNENEVITGAVVANNKGFLVIDPEKYSVDQSEIKCDFAPKAGMFIYLNKWGRLKPIILL